MVKRNRRIDRRIAVALAIALAVLPIPATAQFWGEQRYNRPPPSRGFSFPFFGGGGGYGGYGDQFYRPAPPPQESYKPPPPRKLDTQPTSTVMVVGDNMAEWLAYGLEEVLADTPDIGVTRNIKPASGLVRFDAKNESLEWAGIMKDSLVNDKPNAIVVMLGINDRLPFHDKPPPKPVPPSAAGAQPQAQDKTAQPAAEPPKTPGDQSAAANGPDVSYDFHTDKWAELYAKRIDDMIAALKTKGVPIIWVGLPAVYGTKSTSDMSYLDEIFRARAERAGIVYIDIWDGFVDESGRYVTQGPDFEGQIRRLRTGDGVHFTKFGAVKMAQYVAQALRRVMLNRAVPVALPSDSAAPPKPGTGARPVAGPVLPLTVDTAVDSNNNNLLGDGGRTTPANVDPVAVRVLSHGDPIAAPSGRADDFSWPRHGSDANTAEAAPEPAAAAPPAPAPKGAPAGPKKVDDPKTKVAPAAPAAPPAPVRRSPNASLDGGPPPRPPASIGGGF